MTRHTISVLVENKFGVLARIAGLFSGRGYNIHTLNVAPSQDPLYSRMTIVVSEKENVLDQIIKSLKKLVNVVDVIDYRTADSIDRELLLVRIGVTRENRNELLTICHTFKAEILDFSHDFISVEMTGHSRKINQFLALLQDFDVQHLSRTGQIAMPNVGQ